MEQFVKVARAGGYQAAQRRHGIPAPTLKLAVTALEEGVGQRLFERVGRGIRITEAGRRLLRLHERLRSEIEGFRREVGTDGGPLRGTIRIAAQESYVLHLLPPRIRAFLARHPGVSFDIHHDRSAEVARRVAAAEADFGLANDPARRLSSVVAHPRFRFRPVLIVPRGMRVRGRPPTLEAIAGLPLILPDRRSEGRRRLDAAFRARRLSPRIVMETGGYTLIRSYVELGLGASVISDLAVTREDRRRFRAYDLTPLLGWREGYLLLRKRRPLSRAASQFLREVDPAFDPRR